MSNIQEIVDYCVNKISEQQKSPLFIAITGDSGSGKSYYSELIRQNLDGRKIEFTYINHDEFLIPRKDREPMKYKYYTEGRFKGKTYWEILENMFYLEKYGKVIDDLKLGNPSIYYPYLRETGDISEVSKIIYPKNYNIFDTTMMLDKMDFIILIDVTQDNIIKSKLKRDSDIRTPEQIIEMHKKVQGYYWEREKPRNANIVIDNNDFDNPKIVTT